MICPYCGDEDSLTQLADVDICVTCNHVVEGLCNHCWIFFSMIYPGEKVEFWWTCKKCGDETGRRTHQDNIHTRKLALTSMKAQGDCD